MLEVIEHILAEKKIVFALFNENQKLVQLSRHFKKVMPIEMDSLTTHLLDLFPEFVGNESEIAALYKGERKKYVLEKIGRPNQDGEISYYTFSLTSPKQISTREKNILLVIQETSKETSLEQKIQQQRYEILLLQSSLTRAAHSSGVTIIGESIQIQHIRDFVTKIAKYHNSIVLLEGETGTGKNLVARMIHNNSTQTNAPFVEVNCASIPANLIESEIFGYEKGAFTNAVSPKKGLLEEADGGTLFLDEIAELPLALQAKFLSFLETKKFRRLGSTLERTVTTRIIAATNHDLQHAVERKEFRLDLFYRLNVLRLRLPPLRELSGDILRLADHFMSIYAYDFKKKIKSIAPEAQRKLLAYRWPGNIRELRNVIERAVIFANEEVIEAHDILLIDHDQQLPEEVIEPVVPPDDLSLHDMEKRLIIQALSRTRGNQTRAARLLGLSLDTLRYRIKKYEIQY